MEDKIRSLATELLTTYQEIERQFNGMAEMKNNVSKAEAMGAVRESLDQTKRIERELFPLRQQFLAAGGELQHSTKTVFDEAAAVVSKLLPKLSEMEKVAQREREQLSPIIHDSVRGMQMQMAYSKNQ